MHACVCCCVSSVRLVFLKLNPSNNKVGGGGGGGGAGGTNFLMPILCPVFMDMEAESIRRA